MLSRHQKIVDTLAGLAEQVEPVRGAQLASAVVNVNDIISIGVNQLKTHPLQKQYSKNKHSIYLHAEIAAIHQATKHITTQEFRSCNLYVVRVTKDGTVSMAKPCKGCQRCIAAFELDKVYYTTWDGSIAHDM